MSTFYTYNSRDGRGGPFQTGGKGEDWEVKAAGRGAEWVKKLNVNGRNIDER